MSLSVNQLHNRLVKVEDNLERILHSLKTVLGHNVEQVWNPNVLIPRVDLAPAKVTKRGSAAGDPLLSVNFGSRSLDDELENLNIASTLQQEDGGDDGEQEDIKLELPIDVTVQCDAFSLDSSPKEIVPQVTDKGLSLSVARESISQSQSYRCQICGKCFSCSRNLFRHKATIHGSAPRKPCKFCGKTFSDTSAATRHISAVHLQIRNYECSICKSAFKMSSHLQDHLDTVHQSIKNVACTFCTSKFKTNHQLYEHVTRVHKYKRKRLRKSDNKRQSQSSGRSAKDVQSVVDICNVAEKDEEEELQLPINNVVLECSEFSVGSSEGGVTSAIEGGDGISVAGHHRTSDKDNEQSSHCQTCGKFFSSPSNLRRHNAMLHGIKLSQTCKYCNRTFSSGYSAKRHVSYVHLQIKTPSYPRRRKICGICGTAFKCQALLEKHNKALHMDLRRYKCSSCEKAFKHRPSLSRHIKRYCLAKIGEQTETEIQGERCENYDIIETEGYLTVGLNEHDHSMELSNPLQIDEEDDWIENVIQHEDETDRNKVAELIKEEITIMQ